MNDAVIGLISAVAVVVVTKLFDLISERWKRKDAVEDKKEEKASSSDKSRTEMLNAITDLKRDVAALKQDITDFKCEIGKDIGGVKESLETVQSDITACREQVGENKKLAESGQVIEARVRILRFADEIRHKTGHSKDHYDQIMSDIDTYTSYCRNHPDFENGITVSSVKLIRRNFDGSAWEDFE